MYFILYFKNYGEIPLFIKNSDFSQKIAEVVPIRSKALRWKEEYYFEIPIDFKGIENLHVSMGDVTYWHPGKALCLFYGVSQPYSSVSIIGEIVGPLYLLKEIEEDEVEILLDKETKKEDDLIKNLRDKNFKAARRKWLEYSSIAVTIELTKETSRRVGFDIYEEEFGYAIESDGIIVYDGSYTGQAIVHILRTFKNSLERLFDDEVLKRIRVDINEDNYVCLSSFTEERKELPVLLKTMASLYVYLLDYLVGSSL